MKNEMNGKKFLLFCHPCPNGLNTVWQKIFLFSSLACLSLSYGQEIGPVWYFGNHAGLDFNSGTPVVLLDGALSSVEGCATLSDADGQVMFYTNGQTVWNKNHALMSNGTGLNGNISSSQGVVIVQRPGSNTIFYIFTVDTTYTAEFYFGLNYSEVDMSLDGGLGAVTEYKNMFIMTGVTEMLTTVKHGNGIDKWVVSVGFMNSSINAILVTAEGVNIMPVTSSGGPALADNDDRVGSIKVSPDGKKLAHCHNYSGLQLIDFDNTTGLAGDYITLTADGKYGVEFSPSGKLLYTSSAIGLPAVEQYNLEAEDIPSSRINIAMGIQGNGGLQLATDGKIYYCRTQLLEKLDVINNPDLLGTDCNFQSGAVFLEGMTIGFNLPTSTRAEVVLPVLLANYFCLGDTTEFSISSGVDTGTITWDFGDGSTSVEANPSHIYTATGTYVVTVNFEINGIPQTLERTIEILDIPTAAQPSDMIACGNENGQAMFDLDTLRSAILGPEQAVEYHVGFFLTPEDAHAGTNYIPAQYTNTTNPQTIYARVSPDAGSCHAVTSFVLRVVPKPVIIMPDTFAFCKGGAVILTAPAGFDSYLWSTGAVTRSITVSQAGAYTITIADIIDGVTCEAAKTVIVAESTKPEIAHIEINDWTDNNNSIAISVQGTQNTEYSIDGIHYQASPVFAGLVPGRYTVYIRDKNGCGTDEEKVLLLMYPRFFTPNGDGENETWNIKYAYFEPDMVIHVFDRYGKLVNSFKGSEPGWDGTLNGNLLPSTDYWFVVDRSDGRKFKGHFSMLR